MEVPDPGRTRARIRPYLRDREDRPELLDDYTPRGLRPFVLTSGRVTVANLYIGLETQITVRNPNRVPAARMSPQMRAILALCAEPTSIAEISARLQLHLGVTRILVGDLHTAGYLDVQALDPSNTHDPELILRVIRGLREIS